MPIPSWWPHMTDRRFYFLGGFLFGATAGVFLALIILLISIAVTDSC